MTGGASTSCRPTAAPCAHRTCDGKSGPLCPVADRHDLELPGSSSSLVKSATAAGWLSAATFAASPSEGHSTVVRLAHPDGRRVVAVWTNDGPDFAAYGLRGWPRWTVCKITEAARLVRAPKRGRGDVPADPFELDAPESDEDAP